MIRLASALRRGGPASVGELADTVTAAGLADDRQRARVDRLCRWLTCPRRRLLPAFAPVITPQDHAWKDLQMTFSYEFRNQPYQYQNGGLWPFINGFYGCDGSFEIARMPPHIGIGIIYDYDIVLFSFNRLTKLVC